MSGEWCGPADTSHGLAAGDPALQVSERDRDEIVSQFARRSREVPNVPAVTRSKYCDTQAMNLSNVRTKKAESNAEVAEFAENFFDSLTPPRSLRSLRFSQDGTLYSPNDLFSTSGSIRPKRNVRPVSRFENVTSAGLNRCGSIL